jgi:hypothetical protein
MTPEEFATLIKDFEEVSKQTQERSLPEYVKFLKPLLTEGERSAVILGAERINVGLELLLKKILRPVEKKKDPLFQSDAAFGTFSRKIQVIYRLGLIDDDFRSALDLIRDLRNAFAHAVNVESLEQPEYRDRVKQLFEMIDKGNGKMVDSMSDVFDLESLNGQYLTSVLVILIKLDIVTAFVKPATVVLPAQISYKTPV